MESVVITVRVSSVSIYYGVLLNTLKAILEPRLCIRPKKGRILMLVVRVGEVMMTVPEFRLRVNVVMVYVMLSWWMVSTLLFVDWFEYCG